MSVVLVVDDEPTIRRLVAAFLIEGGCETMTAPDAETAWMAIGERKPDAIITDIRLPGMDGVEFAHRGTQRRAFFGYAASVHQRLGIGAHLQQAAAGRVLPQAV